MTYEACKDCGCRVYGVCSNCNEELYILENQHEFMEHPVSDEFLSKAGEQKERLKILQALESR